MDLETNRNLGRSDSRESVSVITHSSQSWALRRGQSSLRSIASIASGVVGQTIEFTSGLDQNQAFDFLAGPYECDSLKKLIQQAEGLSHPSFEFSNAEEGLIKAVASHPQLFQPDGLPLMNRWLWRLFALPMPRLHAQLTALLGQSSVIRIRIDPTQAVKPETLWDDLDLNANCDGIFGEFVHLAKSMKGGDSPDALNALFRQLRDAFFKQQLDRQKAEWVWKIALACPVLKEAREEVEDSIVLSGGHFMKVNQFLLYLRVPSFQTRPRMLDLSEADFHLFKNWLETGEVVDVAHLPLATIQMVYKLIYEDLDVKEFRDSLQHVLCMRISRHSVGKLMLLAASENLPLLMNACVACLQQQFQGLKIKPLADGKYEVCLDSTSEIPDLVEPFKLLLDRTEHLKYVRTCAIIPPSPPPAPPAPSPRAAGRSNFSLCAGIKSCCAAILCCGRRTPNPPVVRTSPPTQPQTVLPPGENRRSSSFRPDMLVNVYPVRRLDLSQYQELTDQELSEFVKSYSHIEELHLMSSSQLTRRGLAELEKLANLHTLCYVVSRRPPVKRLTNLSLLEKLKTVRVQINIDDLKRQDIWEFFHHLPTDLRLEVQVRDSASPLTSQSNAPSQTQPLQILAQTSPALRSLDWQAAAPTAAALKILGEVCSELESTAWRVLTSAPPTNDKTVSIRIDQTSGLNAEAISALLKPCLAQIQQLHLGDCQTLLPSHFKSLHQARHLKQLRIVGCPLALARQVQPLTRGNTPVQLDVWQGHDQEADNLAALLLAAKSASSDQAFICCKNALLNAVSLLDPSAVRLEKLVPPFLKLISTSTKLFSGRSLHESLNEVSGPIPLSIINEIASLISPWIRQEFRLHDVLTMLNTSAFDAVRTQFMTLDPEIVNPRIALLISQLMQDPDLQQRLIIPLKKGLSHYLMKYCQPLTIAQLSPFADQEIPGVLRTFCAKLVQFKFPEALMQTLAHLQWRVRQPAEDSSTMVARLIGVFLCADWAKIFGTPPSHKPVGHMRKHKDEEKSVHYSRPRTKTDSMLPESNTVTTNRRNSADGGRRAEVGSQKSEVSSSILIRTQSNLD